MRRGRAEQRPEVDIAQIDRFAEPGADPVHHAAELTVGVELLKAHRTADELASQAE